MNAARDDLAARGVRVKALEWGEPLAGFHPAILPSGGKMEIMWDQVRGVETFILHPGTPERLHFPTLEAAKAAAQADYEARILAALDVAPAALSDLPAVKALVAEAEARGMDRAAGILDVRADVALVDMGASAETVDALGAAADAIRAAAAATRKEDG